MNVTFFLHLKNAWAEEKNGNFLRAIDYYNDALLIDPNHFETLKAKAKILVKLKKFPEALQILTDVLKVKNNDPFTWYEKAEILRFLGNNSEAISDYNQAIFFADDCLFYQDKRKITHDAQQGRFLCGYEEPIKKSNSYYKASEKESPKLISFKKDNTALIKNDDKKNVDGFLRVIKAEKETDGNLAINNQKQKNASLTSEIIFLFDYYGKKTQCGSGINPKHDLISSKILNLKGIDRKNEEATVANKKYVLSNMDIDRITFFSEQIEPLIEKRDDWVICVMPKSKKAKEPSGIRLVAKKLCRTRFIDGTDLIERPVDREPRHEDGNRDYHAELSSLRITDNNLIKGKNLLLLDDIKTTGNSLKAGKELLLSNGAAQVVMIALGRTCY
jgi:tetratricopeptide (TPR) repeat protein